jgi:tetratricopeptide (TPR) repeat protein
VRLVPADADAFNGLGICWAAKSDLTKAIAAYDEAVRLDPNFAIAWFNRGLALQAAGRGAEAEASFQRARQAGPRLTAPLD